MPLCRLKGNDQFQYDEWNLFVAFDHVCMSADVAGARFICVFVCIYLLWFVGEYNEAINSMRQPTN